jgi:preprotein translocase subunit SecG
MLLVAAVDWRHYIFMIPLILLSVFMMLVILVQRGRGGGLTGALGGMGGQSAFGTKAGDLFTRITIVVAAIWVLLSMASLKVLNQYSSTGGLGTERGQITPVSKTTEGGLLPSATKPADAPTGKTPEEPVGETPSAAPSSNDASSPPPAKADTGDSGAKSPDAAQP